MGGVLLFGILAVLTWAATLRRRVQSQTEVIRATLEATGEGILVVNLRGTILNANLRLAEMWRVPPDSSVNRARLRIRSKNVKAQLIAPEVFH